MRGHQHDGTLVRARLRVEVWIGNFLHEGSRSNRSGAADGPRFLKDRGAREVDVSRFQTWAIEQQIHVPIHSKPLRTLPFVVELWRGCLFGRYQIHRHSAVSHTTADRFQVTRAEEVVTGQTMLVPPKPQHWAPDTGIP